MDWLRNFFITKFLKGFLDKLPLNNKKTILGIVLFILTVIVQVWPDNPVTPLLQAVIKLLQDMGAGDIMNVSLAVIATGLAHKWLKKGDEK